MRAWANPTGGLLYHYFAWRFRQRWRPYLSSIGAWLMSWRPPEQSILLFGPSGGYTLPLEFLRSFRHVVAVDPDPLAQRIFVRRFPKTQTQWVRRDLMSVQGKFEPTAAIDLVEAHPDHAILFCNLLGQLGNLYAEVEPGLLALRRGLENRNWASFHDRLSGPLRPVGAGEGRRYLSNSQLVQTFYAHGPGDLIDHRTEGLGAEKNCQYHSWEIRPGQFHLIESCRQIP